MSDLYTQCTSQFSLPEGVILVHNGRALLNDTDETKTLEDLRIGDGAKIAVRTEVAEHPTRESAEENADSAPVAGAHAKDPFAVPPDPRAPDPSPLAPCICSPLQIFFEVPTCLTRNAYQACWACLHALLEIKLGACGHAAGGRKQNENDATSLKIQTLLKQITALATAAIVSACEEVIMSAS